MPRILNGFKIRTKDKKLIKFKKNKAQEYFEKHKTGRDIILKARQLGFTTYIQLNYLEKALYYPNSVSATIADKAENANKIFRIGKLAWDNLDENFKSLYDLKYNNVKELYFDALNSGYFVGTNMRSGTVNRLLMSEVAYMKNYSETVAGSMEAVPKDGEIALESTANGLNEFHDEYQQAKEGKSEFKPFFFNFTWDDNYRESPPKSDDWIDQYKELARNHNLVLDPVKDFNLDSSQFYWYFNKARRLKAKVKQEYPLSDTEAFLSDSGSVFDLFAVAQLKARTPVDMFKNVKIYEQPVKDGVYIIGGDPAKGTGNDGSALEVLRVLDNGSLKQVASYWDDKIRPDQLGKKTIELAKFYNSAFVVPERNVLSYVIELQNSTYDNIFINRQVGKKTEKQKNEMGWNTTGANRDLLIDDFIEEWEEGHIEIVDSNTISEMKTFVRKDNGRREADSKRHDDSLFGLFLGVQGRKYHRSREAQVQSAYGLPI